MTDPPSTKIECGDPGYHAVADERFNKGFCANPDYVRLADSTEHMTVAVEEAAGEGRRVGVTSGGSRGLSPIQRVRVIVDNTSYTAETHDDVIVYTRRVLEQCSFVPLASVSTLVHLFCSPIGFRAGYYAYEW